MSTTAQERFDAHYITASEIQKTLGVSRSTVMTARRRGYLPDPVQLKGYRAFLWERKPLTPYLEAWSLMLNTRRGGKA